jgi:RNA polymerase sigma-70 factor, ECF subfamily
VAEPTAECVRRAQAGDPQALTELITGQQHYVYSIAMSVLHQPEDAADLTQEAFIRLIRVLPQYSGESRFTTWLYRLVVNLCRDELRRRGRQVQLAPVIEDETEQTNPVDLIADDDRAADPLRALGDNELRVAVRHALDKLEDHYRLSLTLYYFDDLKYTDIAEILDVPLNTVKSYIRRGKERLAILLEEYNDAGTAPERTPATAPAPAKPATLHQRLALGSAR